MPRVVDQNIEPAKLGPHGLNEMQPVRGGATSLDIDGTALRSRSCSSTGWTSSAARLPEIASVKPASASLSAIPNPMPRVHP